nr:hypothetical protein [Candidatus Eremiobacteraeota bacterium]
MEAGAALARVRALSPRARLFVACAFVVLLGVGAVGFFASRDTRVVLFATPLRGDQLAEVEQRLAAWNVPHATVSDNVRVDRA